MTEPFVAEIRIFPFNFAPKDWAFCNGQLLSISQNTALFSLLGTTYGGNGTTTFQLPNLQGVVPMHPGQGPGLSLHQLGEIGGTETITLLEPEMPAHGHNALTAQSSEADRNTAIGNYLAYPSYKAYGGGPQNTTTDYSTTLAGGSQQHNNMQPYLTLNFCIALQGVFPPRT